MGVVVSYIINNLKHPPAYNPKMVALTPEQVQIIKTTWQIPAKDPEGSGEEILFRYFDKYPEHQDRFDSFRNVPILSLKVRFFYVFLFTYFFFKSTNTNDI